MVWKNAERVRVESKEIDLREHTTMFHQHSNETIIPEICDP